MTSFRHLSMATSLLLCSVWGGQAYAQSCELVPGTEDIAFGVIPANPTQATAVNGSVRVRCNREFGNLNSTKVCVGVAAGPWDGGGQRRMALSGDTSRRLGFDLLSSTNQPVGTLAGNGGAPLETTISWNFLEFERTVTLPIRGVIQAGQSGVRSGDYAAAMSATLASRRGNGSCNSATVNQAFQIDATARVVAQCTVRADDLTFPRQTRLDQAVEGQSSLAINCTVGAPYTVSLGPGTSGGNTIATRRMALNGSGTGVVEYELRHTGPGGPLWGDGTGGTGVVNGIGNGGSQNLPVYGRVPVQATPAVGTYRDTVTVTVEY